MSPGNDDEKAGEVEKVATIPPPPGEDDAYNAVTKVGEVDDQWAKLIAESGERDQPKLPEPEPPKSKVTTSAQPSATPTTPAPPAAASTDQEIPRLYKEDEGDDAPTLLHAKQLPLETLNEEDLLSEGGHRMAPPLPPPSSANATGPMRPVTDAAAVLGAMPNMPPSVSSMAPVSSMSSMAPRAPKEPIPYIPATFDLVLRPQNGRDYLPWVIGVAALLGFVTLTVGIVMTLR